MRCRRRDPHLDPRRSKTGIQYRVPTLVASRFARYRPRRARESQNSVFDGPRWTAVTVRHVSSGASCCDTPVENLSASRVVRELLNQNWGNRIPRGSQSTRSHPNERPCAQRFSPLTRVRRTPDRECDEFLEENKRAAIGAAIRADGPCSFTAKGIIVRVASRQGMSTAQKDEKCR